MDTTYRTVLRCSKTDHHGESVSDNCEAEVQGHTTNPASLEVAAIADTDDEYPSLGSSGDFGINEEKFINFELCTFFTIFIMHYY